MSLNKLQDPFLEKLVDAVKELYVDVKLKYKYENLEEDSKKYELDKIKEVNVFKLIEYIKESIDIYVNIKLDEARNSHENKDNNEKLFQGNDEEVYEKMIKKLEADVRNHIKIEYELKLQNEYLQSKLDEYESVCSEMEKLQSKLDSYERQLLSPEYLEMNKKENEILILRAENSNLKNSIAATENNLELLSQRFLDFKAEKEKIILENQELISKLSKKLNDYNTTKSNNNNFNFQINRLEDYSLVENSTNSLSEKNENSKNSTNFSKSRTNCNSNKNGKSSEKKAAALSSRISSKESPNNLALFNSESKGKYTEAKISSYNQNTPNRINKDFNSLMTKGELSPEDIFEKLQGVKASKYIAYSNVFEKLNNDLKAKQNQHGKSKDSLGDDKNNFKKSSSVNQFNSIANYNQNSFEDDSSASNSKANKAENPLSKSDVKEQNDKTKQPIEESAKANLVASQIHRKNNPNSNSVNFSNFNHVMKTNDLNNTPLSGKSNNTVTANLNNKNININNNHEAKQKPITNLNMIFKFKTILNEEANAKNNKIIKIDAKKIVRNPSTNKSKNTSTNSNNEKSVLINFNSNNNNNNNTINVNNYNSDSINLLQNKKTLNFNSTVKTANSSAKSKGKNIVNNTNTINNEARNYDTLKYSINQLKDFLSPNFLGNRSKSKSRSNGKIGNLGINGKK